jgi:hypothetical protein
MKMLASERINVEPNPVVRIKAARPAMKQENAMADSLLNLAMGLGADRPKTRYYGANATSLSRWVSLSPAKERSA